MPKNTGKKLADMLYGDNPERAAFGVYPQAGKRGQRQPSAKQQLEQIFSDDRAMDLPQFGDVDLSVPTAANRALGQRMTEREVGLKRQADRDISPLEKLAGGMQAGRLMGSGLVQAAKSIPTAITKGGKAAEEYIAENIYKPTQPKAYEYAGDVGDFLTSLETDYKLPPMMPEAMALQHLLGPATQQARKAVPQSIQRSEPNFADGGPVQFSGNPDVMQLELAGGGIVSKLAKMARAPAKTKAEIEALAERLAPQVTGEYVRKDAKSAKTVADKTQKQFQREKTLPVDVRPTAEVRTPQPVDIEKLKGEVMIGVPGDPTLTGKTLYSVGDVKLGSPSPQHGGPQYGLYNDEGNFWASGIGAARRVQNLAREAGQQYDAPVLGNYIMMGPESINYAQHFADANLQAIDLSKMTKKQVDQFNKLIRFGSNESGPRPNFPGIEDKGEAYLQMAMDPPLRKHFNALMQQPTVTEALNLPSGTDIRFAITEPSLRDLETGVTGYSMGRMRPDISASELKLSQHPTYSHDIPGQFIGESKYPMPYELSFPDTLKTIREDPKQAPHEFGSLKMVGPRQIIDQQMIDEIRAYEERMKQLTGKKAGGAVRKAEGGGITADDLILEERKL